MTITKIGHCCLLIETQGKKVLTDPGVFSSAQNNLTGIDIILITHEHADHFHLDSLKEIKRNNPSAIIITNSSVGKLIQEAKLDFNVKLVEHEQQDNIDGLVIRGFGTDHADIYPTVPKVLNTGYMVGSEFFYPGDAFFIPQEKVEVLALPVCGPWMLVSEALNYAIKLKPKFVFPVHDGFLKIPGPFHALPTKILGENGIEFKAIETGKVI